MGLIRFFGCCVCQVGQDLEDVLEERDALKAVNQELARRLCGQAETTCSDAASPQSTADAAASEV